jgi:hypothetical protein
MYKDRLAGAVHVNMKP